ncbi:site-specific integrase [Sphingomonas sp. LHG3406-1]|uniref:site-specific integrase n=1 Tax=Sphingomonas sp. LHG3406-1 TaxID=2804617 RepID=UPI00261BFFB6|nr:site-specific integrase [Sphingomonas sp. LHG3406-1]
MLDERQIEALVKRFYEFELEEENRLRLSTGVQFDEANRQAAIGYYERLGSDIKAALARNELESAGKWVSDLLEREGLTAELDELSRSRLQQAVLRASVDVASAMKKRFEGEFHYQPQDPILLADSQQPASVMKAAQATDSAGEAAISPSFSDAAEEYRQRRIRLRSWDGQTALQARKTYELFVQICDDRPLAAYTRQDAARFIRTLQELPRDYGKARRYRRLTPAQIVEIALGEEGSERLSPRTVQRHHSALAALWRDEVEAGRLSESIFGQFRFEGGKRAKDQRQHWPTEKLRLLFGSPVWSGCKSDARRSKAGPYIYRDEKFWIPLIGLFSAMREEEICQLHLVDVRQERNIWIFDLNDRPPRKLKNATARRHVPLHRELLGMGLIEYVQDLAAKGETRLFPSLKPGGADGRFGHGFSKWFGHYRRGIGLYERGLDFHSLRHTAITLLEQADVRREMVAAIAGQVVPGETARYMKGFRVEQLKEAIDLLDPQVDLPFLSLDQQRLSK